jgi:hypothetical protein
VCGLKTLQIAQQSDNGAAMLRIPAICRTLSVPVLAAARPNVRAGAGAAELLVHVATSYAVLVIAQIGVIVYVCCLSLFILVSVVACHFGWVWAVAVEAIQYTRRLTWWFYNCGLFQSRCSIWHEILARAYSVAVIRIGSLQEPHPPAVRQWLRTMLLLWKAALVWTFEAGWQSLARCTRGCWRHQQRASTR